MCKVKICGITNLEDALLCSQLGADALGFIFYHKSPRSIAVKKAKYIISNLDPFITKVGVFVDEEKSKVEAIAKTLNLDVLQFHGKESISYCNFFKKNYKVIKVFFPKNEVDDNLFKYKTDAYLLDIALEEKEKVKTLNKKVLLDIKKITDKKIILSGGLNPSNVKQAVKTARPYAVDVARSVEKIPGKKDKLLVKRFIREVKG